MLLAEWAAGAEELALALEEVLGRLKGTEWVVVTVPVTVMPSIQKKKKKEWVYSNNDEESWLTHDRTWRPGST